MDISAAFVIINKKLRLPDFDDTPEVPFMVISILETGAVADGKTLNTQSIQSAIDQCAASGGGQVVVPAGVFVTGSIWLKSHVELHLSHGAVLQASENMDDYNALDAYPQNYSYMPEGWVGKHLIIAVNQTDIAVTGHGTLDGNSTVFLDYWIPCEWGTYVWSYGCNYGCSTRGFDKTGRPGQLLAFVECDHVRITDITFRDTPCWACFLHGCDYVWIRGIHVYNEKYACNSDGIDIDSCRYVTISDCIIDTGDDAIAIRCAKQRLVKQVEACEYISISNCVLGSCSSVFRFGVGYGMIRNVTVSNINIFRGGVGIQLMTAYLKHGQVSMENLQFRNISADNVSFPLRMSASNGCFIRNVTVDGYQARGMCCSKIAADDTGEISNIRLNNVRIETMEAPFPILRDDAEEERGDTVLLAENTSDLRLSQVRVHIPQEQAHLWKQKSAFTDCAGLAVQDCEI